MPSMTRVGRPKAAKKDKLRLTPVYLTDRQRGQFRRCAKLDGVSLSAWLREAAVERWASAS